MKPFYPPPRIFLISCAFFISSTHSKQFCEHISCSFQTKVKTFCRTIAAGGLIVFYEGLSRGILTVHQKEFQHFELTSRFIVPNEHWQGIVLNRQRYVKNDTSKS